MPIRHLLALAAVLPALASTVHAQSPQAPAAYAVLSLVGDQIDAVTYQPQTGTLLDANDHQAIKFNPDVLDTVALRETNTALRATVAVSDVALLATSAPALFVDESHYFDGDHVKLPPDIDTAVQQAKASRLVLITKHRGQAKLQVSDGFIGSGKIEGLGFYVDTVHHLIDGDTNEESVGFLAPFVYVDVTLVDTASHAVLRQTTITASETVVATHKKAGAAAWNALTGEEKMGALSGMLSKNLARVIPELVRSDANAQPIAAASR